METIKTKNQALENRIRELEGFLEDLQNNINDLASENARLQREQTTKLWPIGPVYLLIDSKNQPAAICSTIDQAMDIFYELYPEYKKIKPEELMDQWIFEEFMNVLIENGTNS